MRKNLTFASKKANVFTDTFMVIISVIVFAIIAYNGYMIYQELNADIQGSDMNADAKQASGSVFDKYAATMDGAFMTIFILLWILVIVASFLLDAHPIFFIISILLLFFIIYVGAVMSNYYVDMIDDDSFIGFQDKFPNSNFVITNIVWFIVAIGASIAMVLYGKVAVIGT